MVDKFQLWIKMSNQDPWEMDDFYPYMDQVRYRLDQLRGELAGTGMAGFEYRIVQVNVVLESPP